MSFLKREKKDPTWWNSTISSEPICKISLWKSNSYYVFISTLAYLLNEEETDQTGRESLQQPITANGLQLSAKNDAPSQRERERGREGERQTASEGRSKSERLRDGAQEKETSVCKKKHRKGQERWIDRENVMKELKNGFKLVFLLCGVLESGCCLKSCCPIHSENLSLFEVI